MFAVIGLICHRRPCRQYHHAVGNLLFLPPDSRYQAVGQRTNPPRTDVYLIHDLDLRHRRRWRNQHCWADCRRPRHRCRARRTTNAVTADARQEDGSLAMRPRTVKIWSENSKMVRTTSIPDMNQIVGNSMTWNPDQGCWVESHGGASWDRQLIIARDTPSKARTQAAITGDQTRGQRQPQFCRRRRTRHHQNQPPPAGFFNALKPPTYQEQRYEPEPEPEPTIVATPVAPQPSRGMDCIQTPSLGARLFHRSQDRRLAGHLRHQSGLQHRHHRQPRALAKPPPHITSLALALRYGHQVVILDGKGGGWT